MKSVVSFSFLIVSLLYQSSCVQSIDKDSSKHQESQKDSMSQLRYAGNFRIIDADFGKELTVIQPWKGSNQSITYRLISGDSQGNLPSNDSLVNIQLPVKRIICLSTTHLGFLSVLKSEEKIVGISGTRWTHNPVLRKQVEDGYTTEVGMNMPYDYETIVRLNPDLVFAFGIDNQSSVYIKRLEELGVKVVLVAEFMEQHPLGKAEWVKFFAAFTNQDSLAHSFFNKIAENYLNLSDIAIVGNDRPTVFTGLPWKGDWFVPGGASFQAKLLKDAGAHYLWHENISTSGMVVDIETVFQKALEADYWLNLNDYEFKDEIAKIDNRYIEFKAFKLGNLYNNNARKNENSGNDYWESGVVRPDIVLHDLIKIFHPSLVEEHQLYYYQQLN